MTHGPQKGQMILILGQCPTAPSAYDCVAPGTGRHYVIAKTFIDNLRGVDFIEEVPDNVWTPFVESLRRERDQPKIDQLYESYNRRKQSHVQSSILTEPTIHVQRQGFGDGTQVPTHAEELHDDI